jgi:hypothetical protein
LPRQPTRRLLAQAGVALILFAYLLYVRTAGVSQTFWMLGDQIRDWSIALGSWRDLPLTGTPSSVGGSSLGPIFYWVLWAIRVVVGRWTGNLPHAGAIGLSMLQTAADILLLMAINRRTGSLLFAAAVTLLMATGPLDLALTATIWNPALSVTLVKGAMALVLFADTPVSLGRSAAIAIAVWLAVQAHSSAVFIAAPVLAALVLRDLTSRQWSTAAQRTRLIIELIAVLQVPLLLHILSQPAAPAGPQTVISGVAYTLAHPSELHLYDSATGVAAMLHLLLVSPWTLPYPVVWLLVPAVAAGYHARRDLALVSVTLLPLACAVAGFALWRQPLDAYWFLTLVPAVVLTVGLAGRASSRTARPASIALLALALVVQPGRIAAAHRLHRLPEYAALVRGAREIRAYTPDVRRIDTELTLPQTTDPAFLYKVLGGRVTDASTLVATIESSGRVRFSQALP